MDPASGARDLCIYHCVRGPQKPGLLALPAGNALRNDLLALPCLAPMDIRSWCKCSSGSSDGEAAHLGRSSRGGGSSVSLSVASALPPLGGSNPGKQRWRELWMRLKKEKGKVPAEAPVSYDFDNYSQNFDQGIAWDEPENLSRSFSVRFANPASRILAKKRVVK